MIKKILLSLLILIAATSAVEAAEQKTEPTFKERTANLAEVQSIRFGYGSGTIRIVVDITKNVEFKESYVENPSRIIIDLKNTWLNPKVQREFEFKSLAAKKLRIAQFDPTTVRIVIETMADTRPFFLSGGKAGHRFVVDVGNAEFKEDPELNKPDPKPTNPPPAPTNSNPSTPTVREIPTDIEIVDPEDEKLKEQQERELKEKRERELKEQQERELKEQQERELKEKQERELKEKQERELREKREREIKEQRERELREQQERELKEKREKELKEQQERELKEQRKREKELKEQQERELKEKREREIKEQREREKQLEKERKEQEKRDKKEKEKKSKDNDEEKTVDKPFKDLEDDLDRLTNLRGRVIAIDPGHGGNDAGAIGPSGVMEKNVTLKVALELQRLLEAEGATVIMTRETDRTVSSKGAKASDIEELNARCEVANRAGAEIFISIHADSFTRPEARGTTGYYYSKSTTGRGQKLADCIRRNLIEQLGTPSRGTQPCNFYVVKNTDMPATLIELGFISNKEEEKLLDSKEGVMKAAQGIFDGIEDYFG